MRFVQLSIGAEGMRMKEGASINKSLLTLGTVINKLSEGVAVQGELLSSWPSCSCPLFMACGDQKEKAAWQVRSEPAACWAAACWPV